MPKQFIIAKCLREGQEMERTDMEIGRELHGEHRIEEKVENTERRISQMLLSRAGP